MSSVVSIQASKKALVTAAVVLIAAGGASALVSRALIGSNASSVTAFSQLDARAAVPFLGPFAASPKQGAVCGPGVRLMEGALRHTRPPVRTSPARNCVGLATTRQLKRFQRRHHIPPSGIYGERTHRALAHAYTRAQIRDLVYLDKRRADAVHTHAILIVTAHARALQGLMQYCDFGSLSRCGQRATWPSWPDVPRHTDCSGYVQWVYFQAGLPDPNGSGVGNTTSLVLHGLNVPAGGPLHIGDLIFYGANSHVEVYIGHGLTSGHGSFGIHIHAYSYRSIYAIRRYFG